MRADFRVMNWLGSPSPYKSVIGLEGGPVPAETGMTNLSVLALLIAKNGFRPKVTGWGQHSGPFGLTQRDAFLLMEMGPYLQGLIDGAGLNSITTLQSYLEPELMRLAAEFEQVPPPAEGEVGAEAAV